MSAASGRARFQAFGAFKSDKRVGFHLGRWADSLDEATANRKQARPRAAELADPHIAWSAMAKPFQVFKLPASGDSIWLAEAEDLQEAVAQAKLAHVVEPDFDYCVVDTATGDIETIELSDHLA